MAADQITIEIAAGPTVPGLLLVPPKPFACLVLAHGAGAGMAHPFLTAVAEGLHQRGIATLRYQFPYMEAGSRRPDRPPLAHATVRAAVAAAARRAPGVKLIAGGKSFGGRMTSQAQSETALRGVAGLAFFGFPLHPAGKPSDERAQHLRDIRVPMLFLQGARDALADRTLLEAVLAGLGPLATGHFVPHADHSLHVPARSGTTDQQVMAGALDMLTDWARGVVGRA